MAAVFRRLLLVPICTAIAAPPAAADCFRWTFSHGANPPDCLEATVHLPNSNACHWKSPQEACNSMIQEYQQGAGLGTLYAQPVTPTEDPLIYWCSYTFFIDNEQSAPSDLSLVWAEPVGVAAWCSIQANGPYGSCHDGYWLPLLHLPNGQGGFTAIPSGVYAEERPAGGYFTAFQKRVIRGLNIIRNKTAANPKALKSDVDGLFPETNCPNGLIHPDVNPAHDCTAQVHHVVPRVEGALSCPCGTSSHKNAVLVSRKLNIQLSNNEPLPAFLAAVGQIPPYTCSDYVSFRSSDTDPLDDNPLIDPDRRLLWPIPSALDGKGPKGPPVGLPGGSSDEKTGEKVRPKPRPDLPKGRPTP